ncbi:MAG: hypothetical protein CMH60_02910, partial [Myxococcales bacterium]|nr:hypothetical protein [Myxococcales bacterium]
RHEIYNRLGQDWVFYYAAEAIFTPVLYPQKAGEAKEAIDSLPEGAEKDQLLSLWGRGAEIIETWFEAVAWDEYKVIGFNSHFNQNMASLALAKRIKDTHPDLTICVGGANAEGVSGRQMLESFPFIDYVFSGAADQTFPEFVERLIRNPLLLQAEQFPGLVWRGVNGSIEYNRATTLCDMKSVPLPDFDDFFLQLDENCMGETHLHREERLIPYEISRGCWWGEISHCTFCGLNGEAMRYRVKPDAQVLDELEALVGKYKPFKVCCLDNILPREFFKNLLPEMIRREIPCEFSFEVKANLNREQVELISQIGTTEIQPGIESLSTRILGLMQKGASMLHNVRMLRLAQEHEMEVIWLHLYKFPYERLEDYEQVVDLMPKLYHLHPPVQFDTNMSVRRFSPYFDRPEEYGIVNMRTAGHFSKLYDLPEKALFNLAYRFDFDYADGVPAGEREKIPSTLQPALTIWRKAFARGADLALFTGQGESLVVDSRGEDIKAFWLGREAHYLMKFFDTMRSAENLERFASKEAYEDIWYDEKQARVDISGYARRLEAVGIEVRRIDAEMGLCLSELIASGLVLEENQTYLSVAIPRDAQILNRQLPLLPDTVVLEVPQESVAVSAVSAQ